MTNLDYFELDVVDVAADIAAQVPKVASVHLFGSRKYLGKVRSDLDLLIAGPANTPPLLEFRSRTQHYNPLDLWLATGETAVSAVNGSYLPVRALQTYELFPGPVTLPVELRKQLFRADINYMMTVIPPGSYAPVRGDHLGITHRLPTLLSSELIHTAEAIVRIIDNSFEAIRRMRKDGNARRGTGTQLVMRTEYDIQNLTELALSPISSLEREPFTVKCQGVERSADFSFSNGRLVLELKMSKTRGELDRAIKDVQGALGCYLDHPGVEIALAVLAVTPKANAEKNLIESWVLDRGNQKAIMRVITIPEDILTGVESTQRRRLEHPPRVRMNPPASSSA